MTLQTSVRPSSRGGLGCLVIFALPFALIGTGVLYLALWPVYRSMQAQSWTQVPAIVHEASVETSSGSKGGSTYHLVARYSYEVNRTNYDGDRVSFYTGSDNVDSFHHDRLEDLSPYVGSDKPFRVYVNPDDPNDAVLFPTIRWGATGGLGIFGLIFALVGYGLMIAGIFGSRSSRDQAARETSHPNQPWMHRKAWAERRVTCDSKAKVLLMAFVAIIWNGISSFIPFVIIRDLQSSSPNYLILLLLLFPLIGVGLIWGLVVSILRWRRFGTSHLTWAENPVRRGSTLRATLIAPPKLLEVAKQLDVSLICQEHFTSGSGKNRSTRTTTVAQEKLTMPLSSSMSRGYETQIPIKINVPQGGHDTLDSGNPRFSWKLSAHANIPGADYAAEFELPVFEHP